MIAAGTSAPIAIAANATPANQAGNMSSNSCGMTSCGFGSPSRPIGCVPAAMATQPSSASRPSTKEYAGRIAAFRRMVLRLLDDSVAVTECGYMNNASAEPSAERGVGPDLTVAGDERTRSACPVAALTRGHLRLGGAEDLLPAAELRRQVEDRDQDHEVDQRVLDEGDHRGRPQPGGVRVGGKHGERDEQRQVLGEQVVATADADDLEHGLDADQLQRDVGHRGQDPGHGDGEGQARASRSGRARSRRW